MLNYVEQLWFRVNHYGPNGTQLRARVQAEVAILQCCGQGHSVESKDKLPKQFAKQLQWIDDGSYRLQNHRIAWILNASAAMISLLLP